MKLSRLIFAILLSCVVVACSNPQPGPDKTAGGALSGAGVGAGAGAIIGNQVSFPGEGAALGAAFGLVSGALSGGAHDLTEGAVLDLQRELETLKVQNLSNRQQIAGLQTKLDHSVTADMAGGIYQVFFDDDETSLRAGAFANLEVISDAIRMSPHAYAVQVVGHTDDSGTPEYNERLAEARARNVSAYIASRGVSMNQIKVSSFGAKRPVASNTTPIGRQLNRRVDVYISK